MALHHDIEAEIRENRLPAEWTTVDLLGNANLKGRYAENTLKTAPSNYSLSLPGLELGSGHNVNQENPTYYRVGRRDGSILYSLPSHNSSSLNDSRNNPVTGAVKGAVPDDTREEPILEEEGCSTDSIVTKAAESLSKIARKAVAELTAAIQSKSAWDDQLRNYIWKGRTFFETQARLAEILWRGSVFSRLIMSSQGWTSEDQCRAVDWASSIFEWGGTRQRRAITWEKVYNTLENALRNRIVHDGAPINSGYTKVASFGTAYLDGKQECGTSQVMNDSRVAASITSRLDAILQKTEYSSYSPKVLFPGLGRVDAARGGTRPRILRLDWPDAYQTWSGQFAATRVVATIREVLNSDSSFPRMPSGSGGETLWTLRGVEAVLFMDGY